MFLIHPGTRFSNTIKNSKIQITAICIFQRVQESFILCWIPKFPLALRLPLQVHWLLGHCIQVSLQIIIEPAGNDLTTFQPVLFFSGFQITPLFNCFSKARSLSTATPTNFRAITIEITRIEPVISCSIVCAAFNTLPVSRKQM